MSKHQTYPLTPRSDGVIDGVDFLPRRMGAKKPARDWGWLNVSTSIANPVPNNGLPFLGQEGRCARDHRWKLCEAGKSRRDIPFYKGGQIYKHSSHSPSGESAINR